MAPQIDSVAALGLCLALFALYLAYLAISRLVFSPIAKFPGPRLAALTNWYEFYYDVILQGKFTAHIQDLHKQYGPIIRITPTELHIDDPDYFDTLYARGGRRDKYAYFANRFGGASDSFSTVGHDAHRLRRRAVGPFFSAGKISSFQGVIRAKVAKFCDILESEYQGGAVVPLSRGWMALTTDIISLYAFATSYDQLDSPLFRDTLHEALAAIYVTGHFALHFPAVFPVLDRLPEHLVRAAQPAVLPVVGLRRDLAARIRAIREGRDTAHRTKDHPTVFHELLRSDLPEAEKTDARLGDEAQLVIAAGLITTSWALTVASFHLVRSPDTLSRLREALAGVGEADWRALEKRPYLHACVRESIRLSHGIVTRDPRVAPDDELDYFGWTIPPGTPVSMTTVVVLMNPDIFPEPDRFRPERWIGNPGLDKYFVPFGRGSRQCLGIHLAMAELHIAIAAVFTRFDFELFETDESDVRMEHAYLVPYPKWESKGVRVTIKRRL